MVLHPWILAARVALTWMLVAVVGAEYSVTCTVQITCSSSSSRQTSLTADEARSFSIRPVPEQLRGQADAGKRSRMQRQQQQSTICTWQVVGPAWPAMQRRDGGLANGRHVDALHPDLQRQEASIQFHE